MIVGISASYLYARYRGYSEAAQMLEPLRRIAKWLYERSLYVPRFMRWFKDKLKDPALSLRAAFERPKARSRCYNSCRNGVSPGPLQV